MNETRPRSGIHLALALGVLAVLIALPTRARAATDFEDQVHATAARYSARAQAPDARQAVLEGHVGRTNQMLLDLVPDERKTAADWFVVGNMLYRADVAASDRAMKKAEALLPDEPAILLERGMAEHRARRCTEALGYYDRFHATSAGKEQFVSWAYSTQCHLMLGEVDKALAEWPHAEFGGHHVAIESAMYEIFSTRSPDREREALVGAASKTNPEALCQLMDLDAKWEVDWWNTKARTDYMEQDTRLAHDLLAGDAKALADFDLCHDGATLSEADFVKRLADAGYWGTKPALPRSPKLTLMAVNALTATETATPRDVLDAWGDALEKRLAAAPADRATLEVLGFLYVKVHDRPRLKIIDRQGWTLLHLRSFAESYVIGRVITDEPVADALVSAFADFPDSPLIAYLRLRREVQGVPRPRAFADLIAANFASAAHPYPEGMRLSEAMHLLAEHRAKGFRPED
jgi:hypothetical protein